MDDLHIFLAHAIQLEREAARHYEELTEQIRRYCAEESIPLLGTIPYDKEAIAAINSGQSLLERGGPASEAIRAIHHKVMKELEAL